MLDRMRNKNLFRLKKQLKELAKESVQPDVIDKQPTHFGNPYSYYGILHRRPPRPVGY